MVAGEFNNNNEEDMVDRLAKIEFANPICADCPAQGPRWASFLKDRFHNNKRSTSNGTAINNNGGGSADNNNNNNIEVQGYLSVMVCDDCAVRHHEILGPKRCTIKCLECFHEWSHVEVDIILNSGNALVNEIYERTLEVSGEFDKDLVLTDNAEFEDNRRSKFIKNKYKKYRYRDDECLQAVLEEIQELKQQQQQQQQQKQQQHQQHQPSDTSQRPSLNQTNARGWGSESTLKIKKKSSSFRNLLTRGESNSGNNSNSNNGGSSFSKSFRLSRATKAAMNTIKSHSSSCSDLKFDPTTMMLGGDDSSSDDLQQLQSCGKESISSVTWSEGRSDLGSTTMSWKEQ